MKTKEQKDAKNKSVAKILAELNEGRLNITHGILGEEILVSNVHPSVLSLPEGWGFTDSIVGNNTNMRDVSYSALYFLKPNGGAWPGLVFLC